MKYKIEKIEFPYPPFVKKPNRVRYFVRYKRHWWQPYRYIYKYVSDTKTKVPDFFDTIEAAKAAIDNI